MALSIRTRTLLAMNLLVIALAGLFAWIAGHAAARVVEDRLARDMARNTVAFLHERRLPCTDTVLRDLRRIFAAEFAAVRTSDGTLLAASLPAAERAEFVERLAAQAPARRIRLAGREFRIESEPLRPPPPATGTGATPPPARLHVLLPAALVADARRGAAQRTLLAAVPAVLAATGLAVWLAATLTRPLRRLAGEMDTLAAQATARTTGAPPPAAPGPAQAADNDAAPPPAAPAEIRRLATSFHHLLAELRRTDARLDRERRLAELGRLAARFAHDLKNPLSGIAMNVRVLQDELARAGLDDPSLGIIRTEIGRMDLYLQQLLLLARGPQAPVPGASAAGSADLAAVFRSVLDLLAARCEHAGVRASCCFAAVPAVRGDAETLRQVVLNLMLNALEAMPAGGTLALRLSGGGAGRVRAEVEDSGGGVKVPAGTDIFEPFVSTRPGGAGLGLYACRCVLEPYGGAIDFENRGAGACFWFELPAAAGAEAHG
jgi:signal transduction histidine kinase